jgi:hypothetical protein
MPRKLRTSFVGHPSAILWDGLPDLLVANADSPVGVMFGNGDGTFQAVVH